MSFLYWLRWGDSSPKEKFCNLGHFAGLGDHTAQAWGPALQSESCDVSQIVYRELDCLPQNNTLVPYTDDIMLTGSGEQEVASPSDALVSPIQTRV